MSEEKKKKQDDIKLKKPVQASVEVGFVNEQEVQNITDGTVYATDETGKGTFYGTWSRGREEDGDYEEVKVETEYVNVLRSDAEYLKKFSLDEMRERINNGESLDRVYDDLTKFIMENKDQNPDVVQRAIAQLLGNVDDHYDHGTDNWLGISGYTRTHQGDSAKEILGKIVNTQEDQEIHGLVCSTIHEFGMRLLEDCGITATMLAGGTGSSNHTCLLWKRSDGKYVQSNYDDSYTLEATNMKDAAREVYKRKLGLLNNGYIYFIDNDGSYQEFAMKEEAVWGEELDKRDYNNQSVFDRTIASKPSITGNVTVSNKGSVSAEVKGTLAYGNDTVSKETSYSVGYKKSGVTSLADSSTSVGFKLEHKSEKELENGKKFTETKVVAEYTHLHTNETVYKYNYVPSVDHKEFLDPSAFDEIREWYADQFDSDGNRMKNLEYDLERYSHYLEVFKNRSQNINSPISKEEFIANTQKTYVDGDGVAFSDLDAFGKSNAMKEIERQWEEFVMDNFYNEAEEIANAKLEDITDRIENYDQYKQEYIDENIARFSKIYHTDKEVSEIRSLDTSNFTLFVRRVFGKEKTLLKDNGVELTNGYKLSGSLGFNDVLTYARGNGNTEALFTSFGGDIRLAAEEGLKLDVYNKTSLFSTSVSGGVTADMSLKSGTLTPAVSPGVKLNGSTSYQTRLNDNATLGAGLSGYSVVTRPSIDYGTSAQIHGSYKPSGSDVTIFGSANYGLEKQRIRIGGFNEQTENVRTLGVSVGAQLGQKGSVSLNYNGRFDKLNSTRDRSVVSIGARVNL